MSFDFDDFDGMSSTIQESEFPYKRKIGGRVQKYSPDNADRRKESRGFSPRLSSFLITVTPRSRSSTRNRQTLIDEARIHPESEERIDVNVEERVKGVEEWEGPEEREERSAERWSDGRSWR